MGSRADALAHAAVLRGDPDYVNDAFDRYAAVGRRDVHELAGQVLQAERLSVVHVVPAEGQENSQAGAAVEGEADGEGKS